MTESLDSQIPALAAMLRQADQKHKRYTAAGINKYEETFCQSRRELLAGKVLNIGDPFRVLSRTYPQVTTVEYEYPDPAEIFTNGIPPRIAKLDRIKDDDFIEGTFPEATKTLPANSIDRILAHKSISMHAFEECVKKDFKEIWQEIIRLLKPGGRTYIGPIETDYGSQRDEDMVNFDIVPTLNLLRDDGLIDYRIVYPHDEQAHEAGLGLLVPLSPNCIVIEKADLEGKFHLDKIFPEGKFEKMPSFDHNRKIEAKS